MVSDILKSIFEGVNPTFKEEEKINSYSIRYEGDTFPKFSSELLYQLFDIKHVSDNLILSLTIGEGEPIQLDSTDDIETFIEDIKKEDQIFDDEENVEVKINIDKTESTIKKIYSQPSFNLFWSRLSPIDLLETINKIISENGYVHFLGHASINFSTSHIFFNQEPVPVGPFSQTQKYCHFGDANKYPLISANSFKVNGSAHSLEKNLNILCSLFSMVSIFDISNINSDKLIFRLNGFKAIHGEVSIDTTLLHSHEVFYNLFKWCYASEGNSIDKIGLTRNILSVHYDGSNIANFDQSVVESVQSAFRTYLKENVQQYIEIRGKILDELNWISQKSSEIITEFLKGYKNSIFAFVSFFITVFIIRTLSIGEFNKVFNREVTIIAFALLGLGFIYLLFSAFNLHLEKSRLERKYMNTKGRFLDLLIQKDLENILKGDKEFKYEMGFVKNRFLLYTCLWVLTLTLLFSTVISISSYITWSIIQELFESTFGYLRKYFLT